MLRKTGRVTKTGSRWAALAAVSVTLVGAGAGYAQAPLGSASSDSAVTLQGTGGYILFDLSKQNGRSQPSARLGYQSEALSDTVKSARARSPEAEVRGLWNYAIEVRGTPSGGTASLFGGGSAAAGAQVNVSFGQSYLNSYVRPLDSSIYNADIRGLQQAADLIEAAKKKTPPDTGAVSADSADVRKYRAFLQAAVQKTANRGLKDLLQSALGYAEEVLAYAAAGETMDKPRPPAPDRSYRGMLYDAWYGRLGYRHSSNTFFDAAQPYADQFQTRDFDGYSAQLGYNANFGGRLPVIIGFSGGIARVDNADVLSLVDVTQTQTFTSPDGSTQRSTSGKLSALVGEYRQYTAGTGKFDIVLYPDLENASRDGKMPRASVALDLFGRAQGGVPFIYGIGAYLTQPGAPQRIYGGLNLYRAEDKKLAVDAVTGYNF